MDETCPKHDTHADENPGANSLAMTGVPLPPPRPTRWVPHRKAEVMAAVRGGALSLNEALERYALSLEEYLSWHHRIGLFGIAGLRVNGPQLRRRVRPREH
jgi:Protein of unknown function (DUF1153)